MVKLILISLNLHFSAFLFKKDILPVHMLSLIKIALWIYHHPGIKKIIQESMLKPHHTLLTLKLAQFFLFASYWKRILQETVHSLDMH